MLDEKVKAPGAQNLSSQICFFIPSFGDGGVERMLVNTARGMASLGARVDFIVKQTNAPYLEQLPENVRLIELGDGSQRSITRRFREYLQTHRPDAVISAKGRDNSIAIAAKKVAPTETRFYLRPGTAVSARLDNRRINPLRRWWKLRGIRRLYAQADRIIAVSEGVAEDIARSVRIPRSEITVIRNPNITPEFFQMGAEPPEHPWFKNSSIPVIAGMGGLRRQKDFPTLLRAFTKLRTHRPARLVIFGEGRQHERLESLARELGIAEDVDLPGFTRNPYSHLSRSAMFVLSSLWEGSPNVLTEAMALGTPVVATDCHSGPREILDGGRLGKLVPVGDPESLARAMQETLDRPRPAADLKAATEEYTMEKSAGRYLDTMGIDIRNADTGGHPEVSG
ncbi:glycosyltransferase [Ectothiorhodospira mobilis]|uniref:glycosyltransferase n=1 Tax=Ectothiorhodospira mobilis TaxID=195064 RepID=UPI001EE9968E|nr:glycosyltransferase [Ectothiorhodospira mobilis]MCG5534582.1 glycosyltransferase [Ectothiorhodospira mobilis]